MTGVQTCALPISMFRLDATDYQGGMHHFNISIPEGNYSAGCVLDAIQEVFNGIKDMHGLFFRITLDERSQRVTIHHDGSGPPPCPPGPTHCPVSFGLMFGMIGQEERMYDFGLGFNLGFVKQIYVVDTTSLTSESVIQTMGDAYFLLGIDDMYTVEHRIEDTYIQCLAKILVKRTPEGILYDNGYTVLSNEITFPRPIDMKQVRVRLLDKYGVPVDIHYTNMSVSLEIMEVMNVQLYDNYRNYVWDKEEPHAVKHVSGAAAPFAAPGRNFN